MAVLLKVRTRCGRSHEAQNKTPALAGVPGEGLHQVKNRISR